MAHLDTDRSIGKALLAVSDKTGLVELATALRKHNVKLYATQGTAAHLKASQIMATPVETLTDYPDLFGGRVKTLHPKIFGGLLARSQQTADQETLAHYGIPRFDLLVVNLYPFEASRDAGLAEAELIEQIDIGGVALLRAAAKNFWDLWVISHPSQYAALQKQLATTGASSTLAQRRRAAATAFGQTAHYDVAIFTALNNSLPSEKQDIRLLTSFLKGQRLRYGENPHQQATFYNDNTQDALQQLQGKALSYNNLLDADAACALLAALRPPHARSTQEVAFVIMKHTNPCGAALAPTIEAAYTRALAADPLSAFGGVFASSVPLTAAVARSMTERFFEIVIAPDFEAEALQLFAQHPNRRLLRYEQLPHHHSSYRSALGGLLVQDTDNPRRSTENWKLVTHKKASAKQKNDLCIGLALVAAARSNAIALVKDGQLLGCGTGQTSRVDALRIAIEKAQRADLALAGAVMASEAFFPFPDCVEIAHHAGIVSIVQPGGSRNDKASIDYCQTHGLSMFFSPTRHFKH